MCVSLCDLILENIQNDSNGIYHTILDVNRCGTGQHQKLIF